jgi:predicted TIM-barrel fold metal-dependent hydrolase
MSGVIDAHHHIWRREDLPWLAGPMQPRIFGPYEPIRRDYPIAEYLADIAASGVAASVYVQANWPPESCEAEVAWVQAVAEEVGWPHAIAGYADVTVTDARPQYDRLARYSLMRAVRMQLHWHANPQYRFAPRADVVADPVVQRNVARLADYGWAFELQIFAPQMPQAAELAGASPDVTFIVQHAGMLEDRSPEGWEEWRRGMGLLAARENVVAKLSGLGTFIHRNDTTHIGAIVRATVALFGADRCLFGSNFPIEKLWTSYADLIAAHRAAIAGFSPAEQAAILGGTAARVYRINAAGARPA